MSYRFLKGHGTENDFVILPDPDGTVHGELSPERVRALCDRRAGLGADGVLRVLREESGAWFMDYRNADGSTSEMCGNGVRVFARYLADHEGETFPMEVATRAGVKVITTASDGLLTVDMGSPTVYGRTVVGVPEHTWTALNVNMGNPHAVAFIDDLSQVGPLLSPPDHDSGVYPEGVNVEFVVRRGPQHVAMRVHERGSGETRSCGTGACAVAVAASLADGAQRGTSYRVDLPGGTLRVTWTSDDKVLMTGPALLVAEGVTDL